MAREPPRAERSEATADREVLTPFARGHVPRPRTSRRQIDGVGSTRRAIDNTPRFRTVAPCLGPCLAVRVPWSGALVCSAAVRRYASGFAPWVPSGRYAFATLS